VRSAISMRLAGFSGAQQVTADRGTKVVETHYRVMSFRTMY